MGPSLVVSVPIRGLFNLTEMEEAARASITNETVFPSPLGDYLI